MKDKISSFGELLNHFEDRFGTDRPVFLARCPCRVNLMGMHVEHRGGYVNYVTHSREILAAAAKRADDIVRITDVRSDRFPDRNFSIGDEMEIGEGSSWLDYLNSDPVMKRVSEQQSDWSNYVKAAVLRLQRRFSDISLKGMDVAFYGDIPRSSGLSSSSAMVVISSLLTLAVNQLDIGKEELVELCGEAEWYVGTRGGAGDHAAMLVCLPERISHLRFFPFKVEEYIPLPNGYSIVVCDSRKSAHKAGEVLDAYNQTIAAYNMVLILAKEAMRDLGLDDGLIRRTEHLRDINPLRIPLEDIYRMVLALPTRATREDLLGRFPCQKNKLERIFRTHKPPDRGYRIRSVALFGISECERGRIFADVVRSGDIEEVGRLMSIEHDGDRVVSYDDQEERWRPLDNTVSDEYLGGLIADLNSGEEKRARRAQIHLQSGGYGCSSPELDEMVDIANSVTGVLGAGLTGAGFGGSIRILAERGAVDSLLREMKERYYEPRGLSPFCEVVKPIRGASIIEPGDI